MYTVVQFLCVYKTSYFTIYSCNCHGNEYVLSHRIIYQFFSNPSLESKANLTGIQLLGIIVANGLAPFDPTTSGSIDEKK